MPAWLVWLIIAGVLAVAELTNFAFVLVMAAAGALCGSLAAALGAPIAVQILVAAAATVALLVVVRPPLLHKLQGTRMVHTNADRLVGAEAITLSAVSMDSGLVRLNGAQWTARTVDRSHQIPAGVVVSVVAIEGATAVVAQKLESWRGTP